MRFGSQLEVNLSTLEKNHQKIKAICKSNEMTFMVKADAYGHGLVPITQFSFHELKIKEFGVASLGEAMTLRAKLPRDQFEIYVFSDVNFRDERLIEVYANQRLIPVISSIDNLKIFLSNSEFRHVPLCLKFNTGMNRLGIEMNELEDVVHYLRMNGRKSIDHLMTHLSCASLSIKKNKKNIEQFENFEEVKSALKTSGISISKTSIANSGAIEQGAGLNESHIRPGLMMYGPSSLIPSIKETSLWTGELISTLKTRILRTRLIERGTPIGYGASACPGSGLVAIMALGYGDGFSTSNQGAELKFRDKNYKVVGRVNMDMTQLLLEGGVLGDINVDDDFTVWSPESENFDELCKRSKMIPYEVFTSLTTRISKNYIQ